MLPSLFPEARIMVRISSNILSMFDLCTEAVPEAGVARIRLPTTRRISCNQEGKNPKDQRIVKTD